ncbi:MBL fold metallo-hydrolase [Insolitispirillum peregrinum]|uniref:MBL fold metallo-hydrolase n=1 Tax=Insolitispirillum peregrinum TaxID=80876 RepID=UPI003607B2CF
MRITILGCGGAGGVPMVSAGWGRCDPQEPRNRRLRPSILVEDGAGEALTRILVDTSPDLREQLLRADVRHLDAVVFTHEHADHTHGMDELREVNRAMGRAIPCWASHHTLGSLHERFGYCFLGIEQGQPIFRPWLVPNVVQDDFHIGPVPVSSWTQDHGWSETTGFRFGQVAYTTDVIRLSEQAFDKLHGVDLWIIGTLTDTPHVTHAHVGLALEWIERIRPKRAVLTHMGPGLDYQTLRRSLPVGVAPAYDGMVIDVA